jgi:hypothetical protein
MRFWLINSVVCSQGKLAKNHTHICVRVAKGQIVYEKQLALWRPKAVGKLSLWSPQSQHALRKQTNQSVFKSFTQIEHLPAAKKPFDSQWRYFKKRVPALSKLPLVGNRQSKRQHVNGQHVSMKKHAESIFIGQLSKCSKKCSKIFVFISIKKWSKLISIFIGQIYTNKNCLLHKSLHIVIQH